MPGLGHDVRGAHRDPVAARGAGIAHGDDNGLAQPDTAADLAGDGLRGHCRATWRIDAQQHGLHARVFGSIGQGLRQAIGADAGAEPARALADQARCAHERHLRAVCVLVLGNIAIVVEVDGLAEALGARQHLVPIADVIDQALGAGLVGVIGAAIDQLCHPGNVELAALGDALGQLRRQPFHHLLDHLAKFSGVKPVSVALSKAVL